MTIKVLHIIPGLFTGGAEMMLYKLIANANRHEFAHAVVCMRHDTDIGKDIQRVGCDVHYLNITSVSSGIRGVVHVCGLIRQYGPDIIQGWMYHGNLLASIGALSSRRAALAWNIRCSVSREAGLKAATRMIVRLLAYLSFQPDVILNNSLRSVEQHGVIGYSRRRTKVIPNGFDCEKFYPRDNAGKVIRRELQLDGSVILVGVVARYNPAKDFKTLICAAKVVAKAKPNVHFVLIGKDVDNTNMELAKMINAAGIAERVHLLGMRSDVQEVMAGFDVFALSSVSEGFPNVVGEAMACGVPCVVTDVGDCAEIVGDTGVVVPAQNPNALASGMLDVLTRSTSEMRCLGKRARDRIVAKYSLSRVVRQYEEVYHDLYLGQSPI